MLKRSFVLSLGLSSLLLAGRGFAQETGATRPSPATSAQKSGPRAPARGPLPDPALLDGASHPPEKKPEYGMLGQFELPGSEDAKNDKVGGQQRPPGSPSGSGQPDGKGGGNSSMAGLPQGGQSGGGGGEKLPQPNGAQQGGGTENGKGGPNDPNATASGIQVAELKTDEANGPGGQGPAGVEKPKPVAIGDPAMQIKPAANAPGVIGATTVGQTQQMEKAVGGSGKGAPGDNSNKGVEKGRNMPAGL